MSTEDPLQREIDEALQDVRLQDLGPDGEPAPERGRGKRPDGLVPGTVVGVNQDDVIVGHFRGTVYRTGKPLFGDVSVPK